MTITTDDTTISTPTYMPLRASVMTIEQRIKLMPLIPMDDAQLSYADRLALAVEHSPSRVVIRQDVKPYDWTAEASQKRPIK